jgi:hypothetical protein
MVATIGFNGEKRRRTGVDGWKKRNSVAVGNKIMSIMVKDEDKRHPMIGEDDRHYHSPMTFLVVVGLRQHQVICGRLLRTTTETAGEEEEEAADHPLLQGDRLHLVTIIS